MSWAESTTETGLAALAEAAVRAGHTHLVGIGGDGTHHDILNGIVAANGLGQVTYAPLPLGSGNDWVRTLRTPHRLENWLTMLEQEKTIEHAVGQLSFSDQYQDLEASRSDLRASGLKRTLEDTSGSNKRTLEGTSASLRDASRSASQVRYFLNVAGMAYDAEVLRRAEKSPIKHRLIYPVLTLLFLRDFVAPTVRITYDGQLWEGPVHTINLGIGRYSGGGMRLVPQAEPTARTMALTFAQRLSAWRIIAESWRFYAGSIGQVKGVTLTSATSVHITPLSGRLELEADGEWLGDGQVKARLLDEKLRVVI